MSKKFQVVSFLAVIILLPSIAFASWWNPFSWSWFSSFLNFPNLISDFINGNSSESVTSPVLTKTTDGCGGIIDEGNYLSDKYSEFSSAFETIYNSIYDSTFDGLTINQKNKTTRDLQNLENNIKNEKEILEYLDQKSWQAVKNNLLKATIMLKDWYIKTEKFGFKTDKILSEQEALYIEQVEVVMTQINGYIADAQDIFGAVEEPKWELFNECQERERNKSGKY